MKFLLAFPLTGKYVLYRIYGNGTSFWNGIVYKIDKPIIPDDLVQSSTNAGLFQIDRTTDLFNPGYLPSINSTTNLLDYNSNMLKQRGFTWIATVSCDAKLTWHTSRPQIL